MAYLNRPLETGKLNLKNRLVLPAMHYVAGGRDGEMNSATLDYYEEKTRGGYLGLVVTQHFYMTRQGKASEGQVSIAEDSAIEGMRELVGVIHANGTKVVAQVNHAGSAASASVTGLEVVGVSPVGNPRRGEAPRELTTEEIGTIVRAFAEAAGRVKEAGFDGVEIHGAHGYLLSQFYSPLTNRRTDDYGGPVMNRIRVHLEIIRAVREAVGEDFPILLRFGASDYMDQGATLEDSLIAAPEFEKAGVDLLDVSGGFAGYRNPASKEQGYFAELTEAIREVVSIPVILTGGITDYTVAEELLRNGKADLIGVGRAMIADSSWAKNAMTALDAK